MPPSTALRSAAFFPEPYDGELLYSILARYGVTGYRTAEAAFVDVMGYQPQRPNYLFPFNLDAIAAFAPARMGLTAERLFEDHTLAPYYLVHASRETRESASVAARGGDGRVGRIIGSHAKPIAMPTHLRFCPICLDRMERDGQELHWLRSHQLPIATHCPEHAEPLRNSRVRTDHFMARLQRASHTTCPHDAPLAFPNGSPAGASLMIELSKMAVEAIAGRSPLEGLTSDADGPAISAYLTTSLIERGYDFRAGRVDWGRIAKFLDPMLEQICTYHSGVGLTVQPIPRRGPTVRAGRGTRRSSWLGALLDPGQPIASDALLIVVLLLGRLPKVHLRPPPFGAGPWECINPLADHCGQLLAELKRKQWVGGGVVRGTFECACGCKYTRAEYADGRTSRAYISDFGALLGPFVSERSCRGWSVNQAASALGVDQRTLVRAITDKGIEHGWDPIQFAEKVARLSGRPRQMKA